MLKHLKYERLNGIYMLSNDPSKMQKIKNFIDWPIILTCRATAKLVDFSVLIYCTFKYLAKNLQEH